MITIAILSFSVILISFLIIQSFILKHIYDNNVERAKKSTWSALFVMLFGTYAVLFFITEYLNQENYESNLTITLEVIFIVYLMILLVFQVFETIKLRKMESIGMLGFVPFISRAISILYMLAYLSLYTLP